MSPLLIIGWFVWLILAIFLVFELVGMRSLVRMFPEGWRWWMPIVQHASLAHFALVVCLNPWRMTV